MKGLLNWFKKLETLPKVLIIGVSSMGCLFFLVIFIFFGSAFAVGTYEAITMTDEEREEFREKREAEKIKKQQEEEEKKAEKLKKKEEEENRILEEERKKEQEKIDKENKRKEKEKQKEEQVKAEKEDKRAKEEEKKKKDEEKKQKAKEKEKKEKERLANRKIDELLEQDYKDVKEAELYEGELTIKTEPGILWDENSFMRVVYEMFEIVKVGFDDKDVDSVLVMIEANMTDQKGNEELKPVVTYRYGREDFEELNYDNFKEMAFIEEWRILNEADSYFIHPGIRLNLKDKYLQNLR